MRDMSVRCQSGRILTGSTSLALLFLMAAAAVAQQTAEADFQRAFFLQAHEKDLPSAAEAYLKVLENEQAPEPLRAEAALPP
jgi:hypothetical protein